ADLILEGLRPTLRKVGARRVPTPQRLFCDPFADFLIEGVREFKQPGRIARTSIRALWRWLAKEGLRVTLAELESQIAQATLARETKLQGELVARLHSEAITAIRSASERAGQGTDRRILAVKFGDEDALADVEEMALVLGGAAELSPLRGLLPRRIDML